MIVNRRSLWGASLLAFAFAVAGSTQASVQCYGYYDSRSGSSGGQTFCWLSGSICYECVYEGPGSAGSCSNDWTPCDPRPPQPAVQTAAFPSSAPEATASTAPIRICEVTSPGPTLRSETLF